MSIHNSVLIGEAGSGKTEITADLALRLAEDMFVPVYLIDMDQAKCTFRARDSSSLLEKGHAYMTVNSELWDSPLMPQGVTPLLKSGSICCISGAGGNAVDAAMPGQLTGLMAGEDTSYYYVTNPCRAFSENVEDILESLSVIPIPTRISTKGLKFIADSFVGECTTPELIVEYVRHLKAEPGKAGLELYGLAISERFFGEVRKLAGLSILELNAFVDRLYVRMKHLIWRSIGGSPYES